MEKKEVVRACARERERERGGGGGESGKGSERVERWIKINQEDVSLKVGDRMLFKGEY